MYIKVNTLFMYRNMYLCIDRQNGGGGGQKEYYLEIFQWNFYVI